MSGLNLTWARFTWARHTLAGFGLVVLGGCANGIVGPTYISPSYFPSDLSYPASHGPIYTNIVGNPFEAPGNRVNGIITSSLADGRNYTPKLTFSPEKQQDSPSPYYVVFLFNPALNARPEKICAEPEQPRSNPEPGVIRVLVAYCAVGTEINSTRGRLADVTDPEDERFKAFVRSISAEIFPPRNPNLLGDDSFIISSL